MWSTFRTVLRVNLREKSGLFWLFCFPILLSSMFLGLFTNLEKAYEIYTLDMAVVADSNFCKATAARQVLDALQESPTVITACNAETVDSTQSVTDSDTDLQKLLRIRSVESTQKATELINTDHDVRGYISVDGDGAMQLTVSRNTVSVMNSPNNAPGISVSASILNNIIGMVNRQGETIDSILQKNAALLQDPSFMERLGQDTATTQEVSLTHFKPTEGARYYFALLAMSAIMAMTFAVTAVCTAQANLSPLGLRRSMAPLKKSYQIIGGFLAGWLCTFASLLVAFLYITFVCKISTGGRPVAAVIALIVASFTATALGTLLGALPKLPMGAKIGLTTAIACALSLLSGLYGQGAMEISDTIQRNAPILALINPTQQITNLFYDILYYDSYAPFMRTIGVLMIMSVLALGGATFFLRRQRYEHL